MSEGKIYQSICNIQKDIESIGKDKTNQQQHFRFRGIDDVYNSIHDLLAKHEVFSVPEVLEDRTEERSARSGGVLIYRILKIKYTFYASDGSNISAIVIGEGMDSGDKASNKAMSIAHKYALLQLFTVPTEDMPDPDSESHEVERKTKSNGRSAELKPASEVSPPATKTDDGDEGGLTKEGMNYAKETRLQCGAMWREFKKYLNSQYPGQSIASLFNNNGETMLDLARIRYSER